MKKHILAFLIALLPCIAFAQKNYSALLDRYMQAYAAVHNFSGCVLVSKNGKVIYQKAFEFANREWMVPNTLTTRFPILSIGKQFTAAAILQLEEQGKLRVEDKLSKYFPGYPKGDSVTLHMLLNHTSGIYNYSDNPDFLKIDPNIPVNELKEVYLSLFKDKPFNFSPGTWWSYSNSNYILLGYIIEQVSGETYGDYLLKNVLRKAGMDNSGVFDSHDAIIPRVASGYTKKPGGWTRGGTIPISSGLGAGSIYATARDMHNWGKALYSGKVISDTSLAKMNTPNHGSRGYGYGVYVDSMFNRRAIYHSGGFPGLNTYMIYYPKDEVQIIILANKDTRIDFLPKSFAAILFDYEVVLPHKRNRATIDPTTLKRFVGEYQVAGFPFPLNIIEKDNKLYWRHGEEWELIPSSPTKFYIGESDVEFQLEFMLNDHQEVEHMYFIESGIKTEMKKKSDVGK